MCIILTNWENAKTAAKVALPVSFAIQLLLGRILTGVDEKDTNIMGEPVGREDEAGYIRGQICQEYHEELMHITKRVPCSRLIRNALHFVFMRDLVEDHVAEYASGEGH